MSAPARKRRSSGRIRSNSSESMVSMIDRLLLTPMPMTLSGVTASVLALEVIVLQLLQRSVMGNAHASRVLLRYHEFASRNPGQKLVLRFGDNDAQPAATPEMEPSHDG